MTPRTGLPTFWVTKIAKILAGTQPCRLEAWLGGHYILPKRTDEDQGALAVWRANHTALLDQTVARYRREGGDCDVERFFKVTGQTAIVSGKADLIVQQTDKRPVIVDCKSGEPRDSDVAQVLAEMILVPMAWNAPTMQFNGLVQYRDTSVLLVPAQAEALKGRLFEVVKDLGRTDRPVAAPSEGACRFCPVPDTVCPDRWRPDTDTAPTTTLF